MDTIKFRSMPSGGFKPEVFELPTNPMIVVEPAGHSTYAKTLGEKIIALKDRKPGSLFLFVWQGMKASDVFVIDEEGTQVMLVSLNAA